MNKEITKDRIDSLLFDVGGIIKHHKEKSKEKGEDFSLFSIMGMESNETYTHSAIIASLLDPKHNHYKGVLFLEKFLEKIGYDFSGCDLNNTKIIKEFHIGKIDEACEKGGFIDILIKFDSGETIAIENKIYAGDQKKQLYRYSKYNKSKTVIYYLNLFGTDPSQYSYHTLDIVSICKISYKEEIIEWLSECRELLKKDSILSISIKQYILLLKKLTKTMDKSREIELTNSILDNFESAKYVHANLDKLINTIRESFRQAVILQLKSVLDDTIFRVEAGNTPDYVHSQIWIELVNSKNSTLRFGVESFSGRGNKEGKMLVGVFDKLTQDINIDLVNEFRDQKFSKWWPVYRILTTPEKNTLHLNSGNLLKKISDKGSKSFQDILENTVSQSVKFIYEYKSIVEEIEKIRLIDFNKVETATLDEELD